MKRAKCGWFLLCVFLMMVGLVYIGLASFHNQATASSTKGPSSCVVEDKFEKDIGPEAELLEFSCYFKKWDGAETLHFKVNLKNISDQPQRFRVNIFLNNGKAVGGLLPRKTAKGLVDPGKTTGFVYPVKGMPQKPEAVTLRIQTMSQ